MPTIIGKVVLSQDAQDYLKTGYEGRLRLTHTENPLKRIQFLLVMIDVVYDFKYPAIMDLKMGRKLSALDASQSKMDTNRDTEQRTTQESLGFRITGTQVWTKNELEPVRRLKKSFEWMEEADAQDSRMKDELGDFFSKLDPEIRNTVLDSLISALNAFKEMLSNSTFTLRSSSLLIVYETDTRELKAMTYQKSVNTVPGVFGVYAIDFAHAVKHERDEDMIFGVEQLTGFLKASKETEN